MPISHFYNYYIVGSACLLSCMFAKLAMILNKRTISIFIMNIDMY